MRSTEADREEKDEEGGKVKAEQVGTAESTLGASTQAKKEEEVSKENATDETLEQQSSEEEMTEETNNTVAEVDESMPQDTDENFKTAVDVTTIVVEDKEVTQKEEDEEEDSQLIVPAASGAGSDSSGGDSNTNTSRSESPSEDGYVKVARNTLGIPMSESEFLSIPGCLLRRLKKRQPKEDGRRGMHSRQENEAEQQQIFSVIEIGCTYQSLTIQTLTI